MEIFVNWMSENWLKILTLPAIYFAASTIVSAHSLDREIHPLHTRIYLKLRYKEGSLWWDKDYTVYKVVTVGGGSVDFKLYTDHAVESKALQLPVEYLHLFKRIPKKKEGMVLLSLLK